MNNESVPAIVLSEYDMLSASITFGHVYDNLRNQLYLSICVQDQMNYAMHDRDIHIRLEDLDLFINLLEQQMANLRGANL
jgi:hypothetical protein